MSKPPLLRAGAALILTVALSTAWTQTLPTAPIRNAPETFFGTTVDDPYRDFENTTSPTVAAWMKAHSAHAHAVLRSLPGRAELRDKLERYDASAAARVTDAVRTSGDVYFYQRRSATEDQFKLYVRKGLSGPERLLLFDPETLKARTGKPHAINYFTPSLDGRLVALGVSAAGSEEAALRVLDVGSGRQLGPEISRAEFGGVSFSPDNREIFFNRLQPLAKGQPATDKYQRSVVVVMKPGGSEASLRTVVRAGAASGDIRMAAAEIPYIEVQPDGRVLALAVDGVAREFSAWHTTLARLRAGKAQWARLFDKTDGITALAIAGDRAYALSFKGAPRYKLLAGRLDGFSPATAQLLLPESNRVLTGLVAASDALYVELREGNVKKLLRIQHRDGAPPVEIALPVSGAFALSGGSGRADLPGLLIELESWTRARQVYAVAPDGAVTNTGLQPAGPFDMPADVVTAEVLVRSHDGAMVPMSIIHKQGTRPDGNNPTILYGYAAYGITEEPFFSNSRLAWLDAGGVFAVANPRGSGALGREWHEAGRKLTKPNSWRDFIACAEWLVAQQWTQPSKLGIWGGSAGGILIGRAMTERPDLFAAVVGQVADLDIVRAEVAPSGIPNMPEYGTRKNEAEFRALLAMSTYHHIRDGVNYPAVLLTHGVNDPRVEVWNATKTAARLMAAGAWAKGQRKPVLLRLDYDSGHGIGSTKRQALDERADIFAFMLWQTGHPKFQLPGKP